MGMLGQRGAMAALPDDLSMLPPGTLRGIVSMLAACAAFACMDALLKILAGTFPPAQVAALRGLTGLPLVCL